MSATEPDPEETPHAHTWTTDRVANNVTYQSRACGEHRTVGWAI